MHDFEGGRVSWSERSSNFDYLISNDTSGKSRSGSYYAWLGGEDNETSVLSQDISVESDATFLRFYYIVSSIESCGRLYDMAQISINGVILPAGKIELCSRNNTSNWKASTIDLRRYVGQTVTLAITVQTDVSNASDLWVDDVGFVRRISD